MNFTFSDSLFPFILHGGDYNPEQWPEEIWDEDMALMKSCGVNVVTLPVFGWGNLQTSEDSWNWGWLDRIFDKIDSAGIKICLATATAATPAWLDAKYPDVLRTEETGVRRRHGGRHTFCPHSENFRRLSTNLARKMAERYGNHPAVMLWHVSNEYGSPCYCDACSAAFRKWLLNRYGSLEEINHRWNTAFWGQTFHNWSEIEAPVLNGQRNFQGMLVDYDRFQSESILECAKAEIKVLREVTPHLPITTNMMGTFKNLDYFQWAKEFDIVSWDSYPQRGARPASIAMRHALMRGLKAGKPWMLMEQTPSQQNWQAYNGLKRPGILRLWSYQAMAHGADAVMYFQWRRSPGAQEMFHGAVVEHAGSPEARVFQEVAKLGAELNALGEQTLGGRVRADVAIVFDWDNWWAVEHSSGPSQALRYVNLVESIYTTLFEMGITADFIPEDGDFSKYRVVIAPVLKMVKPGFAERAEAYVEAGGRFVTTFFSGIVDQTDRAFPIGYPGPLQRLLGIWVEESDALAPEESNLVRFIGPEAPSYACGLICDRIHLRGATDIGHYEQDFYATEPAVTRNAFGQGAAYYLGTNLEPQGLEYFFTRIAAEVAIHPALIPEPIDEIEIVARPTLDGDRFFVLNHGSKPVTLRLPEGKFKDLITSRKISGTLSLGKYDVAILTPA